MTELRKPDLSTGKKGQYRTKVGSQFFYFRAFSKEEALDLFLTQQAEQKTNAANQDALQHFHKVFGLLHHWGIENLAYSMWNFIAQNPSEMVGLLGLFGPLKEITFTNYQPIQLHILGEGEHPKPQEMTIPDDVLSYVNDRTEFAYGIANYLETKVLAGKAAELKRLKATAASITEIKTINQAMERFLSSCQKKVMKGLVTGTKIKGSITPGRYGVIDRSVRHFVKWLGPASAVNRLESASTLQDYHDYLMQVVYQDKKWTGAYADDFRITAKQFINWCFVNDFIDKLPKNLRSGELAIPKAKRPVEPYTPAEVRAILQAATPQMRLVLLLCLNCGYTQKDVSDLTPQQVTGWDTDTGYITRKRSKTEDKGSVPTVQYPLWTETWELLQQLGNRAGDHLLTNSNGLPLLRSSIQGTKASKTDNIAVNFGRMMTTLVKNKKITEKKSIKVIRKTSNSALANNPNYRMYAEYFSGHSGHTINETHYQSYDRKSFQDAVAWLHSYYFG